MNRRSTWQADAFAYSVLALVLLIVTCPAYFVFFHNIWRPSGHDNLSGYIEFMLVNFIAPVTFFGVCCKASYEMVVRCKIMDVLPLCLLIIAGEFVAKIAGLFIHDFGVHWLAYTPKIARMVDGATSAALDGGLLMGFLIGAKANWSSKPKKNAGMLDN